MIVRMIPGWRGIYHATRIGILLNIGWSLYHDWYFNIKTMPGRFSTDQVDIHEMRQTEARAVRPRHDDGVGYQSPHYWTLNRIVKMVNPGPGDVVYDLGAGMGRVVCLFARRKVKGCVGIEMFESLCSVARRNAMRVRGRKAPVDIVCEDAAKADIGDGTIYFMYHPFGVRTLNDVLANIKRSLGENPRKITIIYYNSVHEDLLAACDWLQRGDLFYNARNQKITFWTNTTAVAA